MCLLRDAKIEFFFLQLSNVLTYVPRKNWVLGLGIGLGIILNPIMPQNLNQKPKNCYTQTQNLNPKPKNCYTQTQNLNPKSKNI